MNQGPTLVPGVGWEHMLCPGKGKNLEVLFIAFQQDLQDGPFWKEKPSFPNTRGSSEAEPVWGACLQPADGGYFSIYATAV